MKLATDIARSMPIYFSNDLCIVSDDVDEILKISSTENHEMDDLRMLELYTTSFVGFDNTVYRNIKQLELGCTATIHDGIIEQTPYYVHGVPAPKQRENPIERLSDATDHMIKRLLTAASGRQIVLSLSGGYDSRYLACSLKKNGVDNVICYTYGRPGSFEVIQSKRVADALGYKLNIIEYDDNSVKSILREDTAYLSYSNRPDYITYLQNYLAVKYLHNNKLIPADSVFITGLCNDMPTGYYIPTEEAASVYGFSLDGVASYNIADRFIKFELSQDALDLFKADILGFFDRMRIEVKDYQSFISALDSLETANFHSHCYLNMNAVHEFFGYEWLLPCWDRELLDYWYSLAAEDRIKQKTYEEYITHHLAASYGVGEKKNINALTSTQFKEKVLRKIGSVLVRITYPMGIPIKRKTDINNMSILEVELYKAIKEKKAIKADRAALILLLTIYMMEYRYGCDWYEKIKGFMA